MADVKTLDQAAILGMQARFGLTYLSVPDSFSALTQELDGLWKAFCAQSIAHKRMHVKIQGLGYEFSDENSRDFKEHFHVGIPYKMPRLFSHTDKLYVECSKAVLVAAKPIVYEYASHLSDKAGLDFGALVLSGFDEWVSRSLKYFPRTMTQIESANTAAAAPHVDKGLTFGLRESASGLMVYWKGEWVPLEYKPGHIHSYAGLLAQYYTKCALTALCHEVVSNPLTEVTGRTSHVLFADFGDMRYDKNTHGSTQEVFPCGENYGMSFEEFSKYFTSKELVKAY
jgi:hypothetical protein